MSSAATLRRWCSPETAKTGGFEYAGAPLTDHEFGPTLREIASSELSEAKFLLVGLAPTDPRGVQAAMKTAMGLRSSARVCLAIDLSTLEQLDSRLLDCRRVGLLLDDVDIEMPLSALVHDAIEAIRFRSAFVSNATRNLRLGAALHSMLGLSQNLGLGTLGPALPKNKGWGRTSPSFDYVPESVAAATAGFMRTKAQKLDLSAANSGAHVG